MSLSAPQAPNPYQTALAQQITNTQAATQQAQINAVNQNTPYGSLTYNQTGTGLNGVPMYTATQSYTPAAQNLLNTEMSTQQGIGNAANALIGNLGSTLSTPPTFNTNQLTNQMMDWFGNYESPIWNQQQSNLNSQLAAQGITTGSAAYDNAQNLQARNVGDATNQFLMQAEPTAFNQALQTYEAPIQTLGTLLGESAPQSTINSLLTQTPQEQIQPANVTGDIYSSYQGNLNNYQNTVNGISGIASAALGGWAKMSDIRAKENISKVGELENGLPVYVFNYKTDPDGIPEIGLMAQDVEKYNPDAVTERNGIKYVNYAKAVNGNGPKSRS